jgi:hypothetical protein
VAVSDDSDHHRHRTSSVICTCLSSSLWPSIPSAPNRSGNSNSSLLVSTSRSTSGRSRTVIRFGEQLRLCETSPSWRLLRCEALASGLVPTRVSRGRSRRFQFQPLLGHPRPVARLTSKVNPWIVRKMTKGSFFGRVTKRSVLAAGRRVAEGPLTEINDRHLDIPLPCPTHGD